MPKHTLAIDPGGELIRFRAVNKSGHPQYGELKNTSHGAGDFNRIIAKTPSRKLSSVTWLVAAEEAAYSLRLFAQSFPDDPVKISRCLVTVSQGETVFFSEELKSVDVAGGYHLFLISHFKLEAQ